MIPRLRLSLGIHNETETLEKIPRNSETETETAIPSGGSKFQNAVLETENLCQRVFDHVEHDARRETTFLFYYAV